MAALRTERDRAMVQAMLLGGLRRCEVLGLRLEDLRLGEWRVFIADGKGGHQRLVPLSPIVLHDGRRVHEHRTPGGCCDGSGVRRVEGTEPGSAVVGLTGSMRSSPRRGPVPGSCMAPATSCATPV